MCMDTWYIDMANAAFHLIHPLLLNLNGEELAQAGDE